MCLSYSERVHHSKRSTEPSHESTYQQIKHKISNFLFIVHIGVVQQKHEYLTDAQKTCFCDTTNQVSMLTFALALPNNVCKVSMQKCGLLTCFSHFLFACVSWLHLLSLLHCVTYFSIHHFQIMQSFLSRSCFSVCDLLIDATALSLSQ